MKSGEAPTDLNARTGLSTPPGRMRHARWKRRVDLFVRIFNTKDTKDTKEIRYLNAFLLGLALLLEALTLSTLVIDHVSLRTQQKLVQGIAERARRANLGPVILAKNISVFNSAKNVEPMSPLSVGRYDLGRNPFATVVDRIEGCCSSRKQGCVRGSSLNAQFLE